MDLLSGRRQFHKPFSDFGFDEVCAKSAPTIIFPLAND